MWPRPVSCESVEEVPPPPPPRSRPAKGRKVSRPKLDTRHIPELTSAEVKGSVKCCMLLCNVKAVELLEREPEGSWLLRENEAGQKRVSF